jgi:hypothetical protein
MLRASARIAWIVPLPKVAAPPVFKMRFYSEKGKIMSCKGYHCKKNPPMESWECPNCHCAGMVERVERGLWAECDELHTDDLLLCAVCGFTFSGVRMVNYLKKEAGRRIVDSESANSEEPE